MLPPAHVGTDFRTSPCAGLTLYVVLEEFQLVLAVMAGACPTCHRPLQIPDLTPT